MAIPGPGVAISLNTIVGEFGGAVPHSLSEYYRGGGLVPNAPANTAIPTSGQIALGNFYGATNRISIPITLSSNTYNYDLYTNRGPSYVAGISDITLTVNPGVTVGSTSPGSYAMLVPSAFSPGDTITIVNNGLVQGRGGNGGQGGNYSPALNDPGDPGGSGGNAVYVNRPVVITNNGTLAGGGGGGGGGGIQSPPKAGSVYTGGGGGGGAGFDGGSGGPGGSVVPGAVSGGPGGSGTTTSGGSGGNATGVVGGGAGGGRGASGGGGTPGNRSAGGSGGATGSYLVGNPFVTWPATGTRQGSVS